MNTVIMAAKQIFCLLWICVFAGRTSADGHYRCTWHSEDHPHNHDQPNDVISHQMPDTTIPSSQCTKRDSTQMTSYINHCTSQSYVPLMSCDSGKWNCQSFISMCKTLIRQEETRQPVMSLLPPRAQVPEARKLESNPSGSLPRFNPNENYFTMKEMGIAVLVSFIAGATMLAIVILIVWRCRHTHVNSSQRHDSAHQDAKRMAALHAITQIATAFGGGQDGNQFNISNPNYAQVISSKEILDDVLTEHDRVYEEILTRRRSSCSHLECIYANIDRSQVFRNSKRRSKSQSSLQVIDESAEDKQINNEDHQDVTNSNIYTTIKNNTNNDDVTSSSVYAMKKVNNMEQVVPKSPGKGIERKAVSYMLDGEVQDKTEDNTDRGIEITTKTTDSGYMEELFDSGLDISTITNTNVEEDDLPV